MINKACLAMDILLLMGAGLWETFDADPALALHANLAGAALHLLAGVVALAGAPASQALRRLSDWTLASQD